MRMASMRESRDSDRFLVNTQVQLHAPAVPRVWHLVPFILKVFWSIIRKFAPTKISRYTVFQETN